MPITKCATTMYSNLACQIQREWDPELFQERTTFPQIWSKLCAVGSLHSETSGEGLHVLASYAYEEQQDITLGTH
jgi:hypothetical protein